MTTNKKEDYIIMRNSQKIDNKWLWNFYKEQGGKIADSNEFLQNFYFMQSPISFNGEVIGYEKTQRDLSGFFSEMDKKFELASLWQKPTIEKNAMGQDIEVEKFIKVVL